MSLIDDIEPGPTIQVSSVLNRQIGVYGKQCLTDRDRSTCWNSQPSCPQTISLTWQQPKGVILDELAITFQGGFVGRPIEVVCLFVGGEGREFSGKLESVGRVNPIESNACQILDVRSMIQGRAISSLRLRMLDSTDPYGRIVVYDLDLRGRLQEAN